MDKLKIDKLKIDKLKIYKLKCDKTYYEQGKQLIPDEEYDKLEMLCKDLNVGEYSAPKGKIKLPVPMWSLDKNRKIQTIKNCLISDKLDGISCLIFKGKAYTRGNGIYGSDITNIFKNIPEVDEKYAVRGELVVKKQNLDPKFSNTRTMAASIVSKQEVSEKLEFIAYELISMTEPVDLKPTEQMIKLKELGFNVVFHLYLSKCDSLEIILEERQKKSEYNIDGIVVSFNDQPRSAKNLTGNPKYSFAFKKNIIGIETKVIDIQWNLSKTGKYIPIIIVKPIIIDGTTVKRVTGHNLNYLQTKGIGINSTVEVIKSGHIIPFISEVLTTSDKWNIPSDYDCIGKNDTRILTNKLLFFSKTLKIKGFGPKKAEEFVSLNITLDKIIKEGPKVLSSLNEKIRESFLTQIRSASPEEILTAVGFFGENIGLQNIRKKNMHLLPEAQEFVKKFKYLFL